MLSQINTFNLRRKSDGFLSTIKYFINRDMDMPMISSARDVKKIGFDTLIKNLKNKKPYAEIFTLFLVYSKSD